MRGLGAGGGEGTLHNAVRAARAFDGDQAITELVLREGVANLRDRRVQGESRRSDNGGGKEDTAVAVGEEKLGACLGTVEAEDAEVFWADLLDAGVEHTARLAHRRGNAAT
jgi:hypothetical protein